MIKIFKNYDEKLLERQVNDFSLENKVANVDIVLAFSQYGTIQNFVATVTYEPRG